VWGQKNGETEKRGYDDDTSTTTTRKGKKKSFMIFIQRET
jgi:hypothetical protein